VKEGASRRHIHQHPELGFKEFDPKIEFIFTLRGAQNGHEGLFD